MKTTLPGLAISEQVPLAQYTTIGIGGPARYFVEVSAVDELRDALQWADLDSLPVLVLGGGSNMLVSDSGWPGLVIANGISGISAVEASEGFTRLEAGGGVDWDTLVAESVDRNLQGIECLSGIPGTVGASPIQNIGAYGQEVKDTIEWVEALERKTGLVKRFSAEECGFSYRWSRFKGEDKDRYVVTRVAFLLQHGGRPTLRYGDLTRFFEEQGIADPTLVDVRNAVIAVRRGKGMVVAPDIPDSRSCGSFFMNPIVSQEVAKRVKDIVLNDGLISPDSKMPEFPADDGRVKLSAAWLMEKAGLRKGYQAGNVGLSSCHILALINRGGGTSAEILALVEHVKKVVKERFAIELHPEPVFIGFDPQQHDQSTRKAGSNP